MDEFDISAIKIGLIGHHETALAICAVLKQCPEIPVALEPVQAAGGTRAGNAGTTACANGSGALAT